jgi:hypothetical protein
VEAVSARIRVTCKDGALVVADVDVRTIAIFLLTGGNPENRMIMNILPFTVETLIDGVVLDSQIIEKETDAIDPQL